MHPQRMGSMSVALLAALIAADPAPAKGDSVVVHVVNTRPDDERGHIKLAKYKGSATAVAPNAIIITTFYEELCTEPCGIAIDTTDRPLFFFIRDGRSVSYSFRLNEPGEVTLRLAPVRSGLVAGGFILTGMLILPAGIPMWIAGMPKVWIANGPPADGQSFRKLKKAKL
jgi:hypothetical protein